MPGIASSILTGFYNFGKDNRLVGMSTDIASLTVRSPLTLLDKNTDKETKTHAALWQGMDYTFAIALQLTIFPFVPKIGQFLAKNLFKYKNEQLIKGSTEFFNFFVGYFMLTSVLMPLINSSVITKLANYLSEKITGKKLMPHEEEMQNKRKAEIKVYKEKIKAKIKAAFEKVLGESFVNGIINTASTIKKGINLVLTPITYPVNKISTFIGNLTSKSVNSKSSDNEANNNTQNNNGLAKFTKNLIYAGLSLIPLTIIGRKFGPAIGKKLEKFMLKENNVSSTTMLIRTRIADGTAKPLILLASGAPYMAMRKFVDQIVSVIFLKGSEPLINKATRIVSKNYKLDMKKTEGFKSMLVTLFQTFFLLNIALPLFNNEITGRILKKLTNKDDKKDKIETKPDAAKQTNEKEALKTTTTKPVLTTQPVLITQPVAMSDYNNSPFKQFEKFMAQNAVSSKQ